MSQGPTTFEKYVDSLIARTANVSEWILFGLILLCVFARLTLNTEADPDLFTRFAIGKLIFTTGSVPFQDPFAFTPTKAIWHDHELGAALLFYSTWLIGSDVGISILRFLSCGTTAFFIWRAMKLKGASKLFVFSILLFAMLCSSLVWLSTIRAQTITFLFFSLYLWIFACYENTKSNRVLFLLPLIMILWTNSHGGFVVGLAAAGLFCVSQLFCQSTLKEKIEISIAGIATLLAPLINPYGKSFLVFISQAVTVTPDFVPVNPPQTIPEWLPPSFSSIEFYLLIFLLISVVVGMALTKKFVTIEILLLCLVYYLAFTHYRFIPFAILTTAVYGIRPLEALRVRLDQWSALPRVFALFYFLLGFGTISLLVMFAFRPSPFRLQLTTYPVEETSWIEKNILNGSNILTHYNDGSYLLWRLYPRFKISLDGRFDGVYPVSTMADSLAAVSCKNARHEEGLASVNADILFISNDDYFPNSPQCFRNYEEVMSGGHAHVFVKRKESTNEAN